jgi:hypothetical protein
MFDRFRRRVAWPRLLALAALGTALTAAGVPGPAHAEPGVPTAARTVVLLCKFSDRAVEPRSLASYEEIFTADGADTGSLFDYWRDQSYGALDLGQTAVRGWYTLPVTEATYNSWGFDRPRKARACIDAATDVDFGPFRNIVVITNTEGDYTGFVQELTFGGGRRPYGITILWGGLAADGAAQEMAHGYSLGHSWSTRAPGVPEPLFEREYGDPYDVMSAFATYGYTIPYYGYRGGPGFNGPNREWFGWLPGARVVAYSTAGCGSPCSRTFQLADLNTPASPGALLLKVPTATPGHYFTVEYRRRLGWDQGLASDAVYIHEVRTNGIAYLVLNSPRGNGEWRPGETFTAPAVPFSVAVGTADGGKISITVDRASGVASWVEVGGRAAELIQGGPGLFVTQPGSGNLLRYDGRPGSWTVVGGPAAQFAGNKRWLFAIESGGNRVYRHDGRQWTHIGGSATSLIAGSESLYAIEPGTGDVWRFDGVPFVWTKVGGPGAQFVVNDAGLFALNSDRSQVLRFTGTPGAWEPIGWAATELVVTDSGLFALQPGTGNLWKYGGTPFLWTQVGGAGAQFVGSGDTLYGLSSDRQHVLRYGGTPFDWTVVDGPASRIAATGTHLYATSPSGDALRLLTH